MKRIVTQKVEQIPASPADSCGLVGNLKPIPPEANRRVRTSAAMIGLAISMGASSFFLPRQGNSAVAAEPADGSPVTSVPTPVAEAASASTSEVKSAAAEASTVKPSLTETKVQEGKTISPVVPASQTEPPTVAKPIAQPNTVASSQGSQATRLDEPNIQSLRGIAREIKTADAIATPSVSNSVASNQETSGALPVGEAAATSSHVDQLLKAKQAVALNRLRDSSNRLRSSLAEWKSEESVNSSIQATEPSGTMVVPSSVRSITQQASQSSESTYWQPKATVVQPTLDAAASSTAPVAPRKAAQQANVAPELPPVVAAQPVVQPAVSVVYQVKPGDTLGEIASNYGLSPAELAKANDLNNPNRLRVSQLLAIPQSPSIGSLRESRAWNPNRTVVETPLARSAQAIAASEPAAPQRAFSAPASVSSTANMPIIAAFTPHADPSRDEGPTVGLGNSAPLPEALPLSPLGTDARGPEFKGELATVPTPSQSLAKQTSTISGKQSTAVESPEDMTLLTERSADLELAAATQQQYSPYIQRLRAEISQLREQYRNQHQGDRPNPEAEASVTVVPTVPSPLPSPAASTAYVPVNPEFNPNRYNEALQTEVQRRAQQQPERRNSTRTRAAEPALEAPRTPRQLVAVAPTDPQNYQPYLRTAPGQMVAPDLPPLEGPENYLPGGVNPNFNGYIWPTRGVLTSGFGRRWGRMHKGIDIAAPVGTPIVAAAPGVVVYARWNSGGYGNLVDIRHPDGTLTRYAHNSRIFVQEGQVVDQGQHIAAMGSTGFSTGPHLHFEVHPAGRGAVNPIAVLPPRSRR